MIKRYGFLIILLFLFSFVSAAEIDDVVLEKASEGDVRVIVTLKEPIKPLFRESISIQAQQSDIISNLESPIKHRYSIINGFSGELSAEDISKLEADPRVERISYDRPMRILLTGARPQVNATSTHKIQVNGYNITGVGQTICIIDTGVDYTHESLGNCTNTTFLAGNCSKVIGGYDFVNSDADPIDDHGHGTHVSGIAAANGTVKGIAPDAKIVMIKSMDASGDGYASDVIAGIEWCTNNRTTYNISVMSMSIGEGIYNSITCPSAENYTAMKTAIDIAYAANITIAAASGNDKSVVGIVHPACIPNVTSVGAVDDNDGIADFGGGQGTNRASILDLLAPGESITSTKRNGGTTIMSGTSMSTPMAAGAAAILKQFNNSLTPQEIENALKLAGKPIFDSGTQLTFSRLNIYDAIQHINGTLNNTAPNITSFYPTSNISIAEPNSITFNITYIDAENNELVYWYKNNSLVSTSTNYAFLGNYTTAGTYNITVIVADNYESDSVTWILTVNNTNRAPNITSYAPSSPVSMDENTSKPFNITVNDPEGDSLSYSWLLNSTEQATTQNWTYSADYTSSGVYNVTIIVSDSMLSDSIQWSLTVTNVDTTPAFSMIQNKSWYEDDTYTTDLDNYVSDADGDDLNYTSTKPTNINVSINNDTAVVTLIPESGWTGENHITFYAFDPQGHNAASNEITLEVIEYPGDNDDDDSTSTSTSGTSPTTTTTDTTPTPTTLPSPTLKTLSDGEEAEEGEEEAEPITTIGFASRMGEYFGSIKEIKWSTWLIIIGIIAASAIGIYFTYTRRMFGRVGERLEIDFEESMREWRRRKKKKRFIPIPLPDIITRLKKLFKFIRKK